MYNLSKVYEDLLKGNLTCEEASEIIKSPEIQRSVNYLVNMGNVNKLVPYTEEDLQFIYMIINITQFIYNNSGLSTGLSDYTYDILYAIMLANSGKDVVSVPLSTSRNSVVHHKYPALRGTLKKIFYLSKDERRTNPSRRYLDEWISSMEEKIYSTTGRRISLNDEEVYVFPKYDGVSVIFEIDENNNVESALTRGFTEKNEAQNITHVFNHFKKRESCEFKNQPYGLKTEVMMSYDDLAYYNKKYHTDYKNTRSIVSAILNSDEYDRDKSSLLQIVPLRVGTADGTQLLAEEALNEYPHIRCRLKDREVIRKFANSHFTVGDGLRCDGAVIYIINPEIQKILGRENDINNFEVAYKFTEEVSFSKLMDVAFNVGLFGRLAPVAKVKPVKLKGNTIENISLGSVGRFRNLHLRKGDIVKVLYDIIPYLSFDDECTHNYDGIEFEVPEFCPECGNRLNSTDSGDILFCDNPKCPCRIKGKILNYLDKMDIENISYGVINRLYDEGYVKSIKDLYKLEKYKKEIAHMDGFGTKIVQLWLDSIEEQRTVPDYILMGSLGIEGISKKSFAKILSIYNIEELITIVEGNSISQLIKIPGVKEKTAQKIIEGVRENKKLITFLTEELNVIETKGVSNKARFSVCFTKIRDASKEKFIRECGGEVVDSISKSTTFLVVPSLDASSSKIDKAKKYGIKIVHIDDLEATVSEYIK